LFVGESVGISHISRTELSFHSKCILKTIQRKRAWNHELYFNTLSQAKSSYIRQIGNLIGRGKVNSVSECGELRMGPHILPCPVLSTCSVRSTCACP